MKYAYKKCALLGLTSATIILKGNIHFKHFPTQPLCCMNRWHILKLTSTLKDQHRYQANVSLNETLNQSVPQPQVVAENLSVASLGYVARHVGPNVRDLIAMLEYVGFCSLDSLMQAIIPDEFRPLIPILKDAPALSEQDALAHINNIMSRNQILKSLIGNGYYECITPPALQRHVLENPYWYTSYTPYQAEISQGRLESLLNFQTVICSLTKMDIANASMLDMATAVAEAVNLAHNRVHRERFTVFVSNRVFTGVIEMVKCRAAPLGIKVIVDDVFKIDFNNKDLFAVLVQSPNSFGEIHDFSSFFQKVHDADCLAIVNSDPLALCLTKPPGEMGADVVVGSAQRFGIPLGYGGPSAAFFATKDEFKRLMPGRIVGISRDAQGQPAYRLALQTREQHIKRQKAMSNICTAQALLASMSAFYAVYHGPDGLRDIATSVHNKAKLLAVGLLAAGHKILNEDNYFDTITFRPSQGMSADEYSLRCTENGINVYVDNSVNTISISMDEATSDYNIVGLLEVAGMENPDLAELSKIAEMKPAQIPAQLRRSSAYLTDDVFNKYHNETSFMRYVHMLARKDYGLTHGMIPLGSCTMKLNPAICMLPLGWPILNNLHPMAPENQCRGYEAMCIDMINKIKEVTGFAAVSLQPNSGSQGEYCGLRVIHAYQQSNGEGHRDICLIPESAHGTNPASAVQAGLKVVTIKCTKDGGICFIDFEKKINRHKRELAAIMITYPNTYGIFEAGIKKVTAMVHAAGAQVYIDGANLNAMVGFSNPALIGGDVCHINLHKTFSIPHGGGGPGMAPIAVAEHLAPFLPNAWFNRKLGGSSAFGQVSQSPYGSASILHISYMLMLMLGPKGLTDMSAVAVLNANYLCKRLEDHYSIAYKNANGRCGHEFIVDIRPFKKTADIDAEDVAKRLMDYGFHAPTLAFPVPGTLMVEPTESEPKVELDRFADAMISIRQEIKDIESGKYPKNDNLLVNAPHTQYVVTASEWKHPYTREQAAFPSAHTREDKFWPTVGRINNALGDRNLFCTCAGMTQFMNSVDESSSISKETERTEIINDEDKKREETNGHSPLENE